MTFWLMGGWIIFFRYGFGVRGPGINFIFWLGPVK